MAELWDTEPAPVIERLGDPDLDDMACLAISRRQGDLPWNELSAWQRIGPELLECVYGQHDRFRDPIVSESIGHLRSLQWVRRKGLSRIQLAKAASDALDRMITRDCLPAQISALAVACKLSTFLELRQEAIAFQCACLVACAGHWVRARVREI